MMSARKLRPALLAFWLAILLALAIPAAPASAAVEVCTWKGGTGSWTDIAMWDNCGNGSNAKYPTAGDTAIVNSGTVTINASTSIIIDELRLGGGTVNLDGFSTLSTSSLKIEKIAVLTSGALTANQFSTVEFALTSAVSDAAITYTNNGSSIFSGSSIKFTTAPNFSLGNTVTISAGTVEIPTGSTVDAQTVTISGSGHLKTSGNMTITNLTTSGSGDRLTTSGNVSGSTHNVSGGTITVTGTGLYMPNTLNLSGGTISTSAALQFNTLNWSGGTLKSSDGTLRPLTATNLDLSSSAATRTLDARSLELSNYSFPGTGSIALANGAELTLANNILFSVATWGVNLSGSSGKITFNGSSFSVTGQYNFSGTTQFSLSSSSYGVTFSNATNFSMGGPTSVTAGWVELPAAVTSISPSSLSIINGTFQTSGSITTGSLTVDNGYLSATAGISAVTMNVLTNGQVSTSGNVSGTTHTINNGQLSIGGSGTYTVTTLDLTNSGIISTASDITATTLNWESGELFGSGVSLPRPVSVTNFNLTGGGTRTLSRRALTVTSDITDSTTVSAANKITLNSSASLSLKESSSVAWNAEIIAGANEPVTFNGGTFTINATYNVSHSTTFDSGTISFAAGKVTNLGQTIVVSGATVTLPSGVNISPSSLTVSSGSFTTPGTISATSITVSGSGTLTSSDSVSVGTLTVSGGKLSTSAAITASTLAWSGGELEGTGTPPLRATTVTTLQLSGSSNRTLTGRSLAVSTSIADSSSVSSGNKITLSSGATLSLADTGGVAITLNIGITGTTGIVQFNSGTFIVEGIYDVGGTSTFSSGSVTFNNGSSFNLGSTVTVSGASVVLPASENITPTTLTVSSGTFSTSGTINATTLNWSGGTLQGTGASARSTTATTLNLAGSGARILDGRTLTIDENDTQGSGSLSLSGNSVLTLNNGNNATPLAYAMNITGTQGTVAFTGEEFSVTAQVSFGGTMTFNAVKVTFTNATGFALSGTVEIDSGEVILPGSVNVTLTTLDLSAGSFSTSGTISATTLNWAGGTLKGTGPSIPLDTTAGTLDLTGSGARSLDGRSLTINTSVTTGTGSLSLTNNAILTLNSGGGTINFGMNLSAAAGSTVAFGSGEFNINGIYNVTSSSVFSGGTLTFTNTTDFNLGSNVTISGANVILPDLVDPGSGTALNFTNLTLAGGALNTVDDITVTNFTWSDGAINGDSTLPDIIATNTTFTDPLNPVDPDNIAMVLDQFQLFLNGPTTWNASHSLQLLYGSEIQNTGVVTITINVSKSAPVLMTTEDPLASEFTNNGEVIYNNLNTTGTLYSGIDVPFLNKNIDASNGGKITVQEGILILYNGGKLENASTVDVQAGGTLRMVGGFEIATGAGISGAGSVEFDVATARISGALTMSGQLRFVSSTADFTSSASLPASVSRLYVETSTVKLNSSLPNVTSISALSVDTLDMKSGLLEGTGTLNATTMNWSGGTIKITGGVTAGTLNYIDSPGHGLTDTAMTVTGSTAWTGQGTLTLNGSATFTQASGSTMIVNQTLSSLLINLGSGTTGRFINQGTLEKRNSNEVIIGVPVDNDHTILVKGGVLAFTKTLANTTPGSLLRLEGGEIEIRTATKVFDLTQGTLSGFGTFDGTLNNTGGTVVVEPLVTVNISGNRTSYTGLTITGSFNHAANRMLRIRPTIQGSLGYEDYYPEYLYQCSGTPVKCGYRIIGSFVIIEGSSTLAGNLEIAPMNGSGTPVSLPADYWYVFVLSFPNNEYTGGASIPYEGGFAVLSSAPEPPLGWSIYPDQNWLGYALRVYKNDQENDLAISMDDGTTYGQLGGPITYTIDIINNSNPISGFGAWVYGTLPPGVDWDPTNPDNNSTGCNPSVDTKCVYHYYDSAQGRWLFYIDLPNLASGTTQVLIKGILPSSGMGLVENEVTLYFFADPNTNNNTDTDQVIFARLLFLPTVMR